MKKYHLTTSFFVCVALGLLGTSCLSLSLECSPEERALQKAVAENRPLNNIPANVNLNACCVDHDAALIHGAYYGSTSKVASMLQRGADPDVGDQEGRTALMYAAFQNQRGTLSILIFGLSGAKKPNIQAQDDEGWTALMYAAQNGHRAVVTALIGKGARPNIPDKEGWTALMYAAQNGHLRVVKTLIQNASADPNAANDGCWTALMYAARNGHLEVVKFLSKNKANVNLTNRNGYTALDIADKQGHEGIVELLLGGKQKPLRNVRRQGTAQHGTVNNTKSVHITHTGTGDINLQSANFVLHNNPTNGADRYKRRDIGPPK